MGQQTTAILNAIATCVMVVKQQCFADAVATFNLSVQNADVVTISGLNATNTATVSTKSGCKATSQIDMRSLFGNMDEMLNKVIQASQELQGRKTSFISTLTQSLNTHIVETCYASAVAAVNISVQNIGGNVTFDNVTVNNTAHASIANCLQSVQVKTGGGSLPMKQFIENNESWMHPTSSAQAGQQAPVAPQKTALTPQEIEAARQKIFPCSSSLSSNTVAQQAMAVPLKDIWGVTAACAVVALVGAFVSTMRAREPSTGLTSAIKTSDGI